MNYTKEQLIESLHKLEEKYNIEPNTIIIDMDKDSPSRNAYKRVFGSVRNALIEAGYSPKKHQFNKLEAQEKLDSLNRPFDILVYNGMRGNSIIKCKKCNRLSTYSIDSLCRNEGYSNGCGKCYKNRLEK